MRHIVLDPGDLRTSDLYRLLTDLVTPRPIAWVSTLDAEGHGNLAPFSYYQAVCSNPPMVTLAFATRRDGSPKDTLRNILTRREFTINHVNRSQAEAMNATSADVGPERNEWETADAGRPLASAPAERVAPPRVAGSLASLECRLTHAIPLGEGRGPQGRPSSTVILAEVVVFTICERLVERDADGRFQPIDPAQLAAVGRLGGIAYTETDAPFFLPRPKV